MIWFCINRRCCKTNDLATALELYHEALQTKIQIDLVLSKLDSTVDYVVAPETSINNNISIVLTAESPL